MQEYYGEAGTLTFTTPEPMADAGRTRMEEWQLGLLELGPCLVPGSRP